MGKRQAIKSKRKQDNLIKQVLTIFLIVVIAVIIVGLMIYPQIKNTNSDSDVTVPDSVGTHNSSDMNLGDPNAPITVEVYSDYRCSHCGIFAETMEADFIKDYVDTGKVYYEYHPFNFMGEASLAAAEAAYCALDQGDFWDFHDILYANMFNESSGQITYDNLSKYAKAAGLDVNKFQACLDSDKFVNQYEIDNEFAKESGISATPSFKVGDIIVGYGDLVTTMEEALANQ